MSLRLQDGLDTVEITRDVDVLVCKHTKPAYTYHFHFAVPQVLGAFSAAKAAGYSEIPGDDGFIGFIRGSTARLRLQTWNGTTIAVPIPDRAETQLFELLTTVPRTGRRRR